MKIRYPVLVAVALSVGCGANPPPSGTSWPSDLIAIQRAARAVDARTAVVSEAAVRSHMEFLASDALNGRGSGTREEWMAAEYIASQFSAWNLTPLGDEGGYVQAIPLVGFDATGPSVMAVGGLTFTHGRDFLVRSVGRPTLSGQLLKYTGEDSVPMGTMLLMPPGEAFKPIPGAALVIVEATDQDREQWQARGQALPRVATEIVKFITAPLRRATVVVASTETHAALTAMIDRTELTLQTPVGEAKRSYTWNVVAELTGSHERDREDVIVLSAHIDHVGICAEEGDRICNGADDNASGTVAVMELARAIAAGPRPRRTLVFALFGSEEVGGHGASYFVESPTVPLPRIIADIHFEMIGRPDPSVDPGVLWLTGFGRSDLGPALAEHGATLVADPYPDQDFFRRSDNYRFVLEGIVAHTVSSFGMHEDYHRPSDDISKIDFPHLVGAIRSLLEPVRWLAGSDFIPTWNPEGWTR